VSATGPVITSAGILLAAVFCVLGVLPLIVLTQLGVIVGLGILLDTFVVRTVVIPAVFTVIGPRIWWPARVDNTRSSPSRAAVTVILHNRSDFGITHPTQPAAVVGHQINVSVTQFSVFAAPRVAIVRVDRSFRAPLDR